MKGTLPGRRSRRHGDKLRAVLRQLARKVHYGPGAGCTLPPAEADARLHDRAVAVLRAFGAPTDE